MNLGSAKRGSALLIVLGMVSFIIASAVAFSAYMRFTRVPSSFLRRTSASRHLAKAAVAEAIEVLDQAIGNNAHPGIGASEASTLDNNGDYNFNMGRNYWKERVFLGTNGFFNTADTVSTLCVEALAYIPPPLINEARYYSRRSAAGTWHSFKFDAGRYAFCALDVSDYFDINRMTASPGRDSSDLGRIRLGHTFENAAHTGYAADPKAWDEFMEKYRYDRENNASVVPLISVADMNLAIRKDAPSGVKSPFCDYIDNGTAFVLTDPENPSDRDEMVKNMTFITDGIFSVSNRPSTCIDLSRGTDQPFAGFGTDSPDRNEANADTLAQESNKFLDKYVNELSLPEVIQLYDYVDLDSIPVSLAVPTAERVPMVCGLSLEGALDIAAVPGEIRTATKGKPPAAQYYRATPYKIHVGGELVVMAGTVFPFKYNHGENRSFRAQAAATITFVPAEEAVSLRNPQAVAPVAITRGDWPESRQEAKVQKLGNGLPGVITMFSATMPINVPVDISEEEDALMEDVELSFGSINVDLASDIEPSAMMGDGKSDNCAYRVVDQTDDSFSQVIQAGAEQKVGFSPTSADLTQPLMDETQILGKSFIPVVQVWVRILDANGKTVDLVPASIADDESPSEILSDARGSAVKPFLRFQDKQKENSQLTISSEAMAAYETKSVDVYPKAYVADDPRFNYAPECMMACEQLGNADISGLWFSLQRSSERDGDIFMGVSDAGYLQSGFELANILRITGMQGGGEDWGCLNSRSYDGTLRTSMDSLVCNASAWRTYSQYELDSEFRDISPLDIQNGTKGFRVNPFSPSVGVMMSVLANTPLDWWAASTNDAMGGVKSQMLEDLATANKYTFSEHSGAQVPLEHKRLEKLAEQFMNRFANGSSVTWEDVFDRDIVWDVNGKNFTELDGVDLGVPLHTVDRKYLHGFWRECFGAKQQLFLIFVRAEPCMMGGGAGGKSPPQLGARAVALVWRDPSVSVSDTVTGARPHRTRILFYRQFD